MTKHIAAAVCETAFFTEETNMAWNRKQWVRGLCAAALSLGACASVGAQGYPDKAIKLVVGFPPAGASDAIARVVAAKLSERLGQPVVVENRPGANGTLAAGIVAKAPGDGYTLALTGPGSVSLGPLVYKNRLNYDVERDFTPIGLIGSFPLVLVVNPSVPARDLQGFARHAKAHADSIQFASFGNGSPSHLTSEMLKQSLGVKMTHVPFAGSAPAMSNLIGGHVQALFDTIPAAAAQVKDKRVVALGVTSRNRVPQLPEVPTFIESGYSGFEAGGWVGIHAPAGTPAEVVARLNSEINRALALPEVIERLRTLGAQVMPGTPQQLAEFSRTEMRKMRELIESTGLVLE
jgi:tripartite-type tricarboxylate transporter receptor subunit TctC